MKQIGFQKYYKIFENDLFRSPVQFARIYLNFFTTSFIV